MLLFLYKLGNRVVGRREFSGGGKGALRGGGGGGLCIVCMSGHIVHACLGRVNATAVHACLGCRNRCRKGPILSTMLQLYMYTTQLELEGSLPAPVPLSLLR